MHTYDAQNCVFACAFCYKQKSLVATHAQNQNAQIQSNSVTSTWVEKPQRTCFLHNHAVLYEPADINTFSETGP